MNRFIWSRGYWNIPWFVRVRIRRTKNEDEEANEKFTLKIIKEKKMQESKVTAEFDVK